jgi:TrmH family RNA methyltransferase
MTTSQLTSRDNPLIKTIRLVSSGSRRAPKQYVIAEGIRVLEEVQKSACSIEAVLFTDRFGSDAREKKMLQAWKSEGVRCYRTPDKLLDAVSSVQTSQGVLALVKVPEFSLGETVLPENPFILCACGIQDPGNLGTLVRTAAATAVSLVCTIKGTVSARSPKAIRSSAGAIFKIPVIENIEEPDFRRFCEIHSIRLYRTNPGTGVIYTKAKLNSPCAVLLGNEGAGMKEHEFAGSTPIRIPMTDGAESLNVAVAGSVILFEAFRQRGNM